MNEPNQFCLVKIVSGGFVPLAVSVWIGIVGIKAQVDNVVDQAIGQTPR